MNRRDLVYTLRRLADEVDQGADAEMLGERFCRLAAYCLIGTRKLNHAGHLAQQLQFLVWGIEPRTREQAAALRRLD